MTPKQSKTLLFIDMYWEDNAYAPSYDDIRKHLELKSKSNVCRLVNALSKLGYVEHMPFIRRTVRPVRIPEALIKKKLKLRKDGVNYG